MATQALTCSWTKGNPDQGGALGHLTAGKEIVIVRERVVWPYEKQATRSTA
jgi:hypothetical protein